MVQLSLTYLLRVLVVLLYWQVTCLEDAVAGSSSQDSWTNTSNVWMTSLIPTPSLHKIQPTSMTSISPLNSKISLSHDQRIESVRMSPRSLSTTIIYSSPTTAQDVTVSPSSLMMSSVTSLMMIGSGDTLLPLEPSVSKEAMRPSSTNRSSSSSILNTSLTLLHKSPSIFPLSTLLLPSSTPLKIYSPSPSQSLIISSVPIPSTLVSVTSTTLSLPSSTPTQMISLVTPSQSLIISSTPLTLKPGSITSTKPSPKSISIQPNMSSSSTVDGDALSRSIAVFTSPSLLPTLPIESSLSSSSTAVIQSSLSTPLETSLSSGKSSFVSPSRTISSSSLIPSSVETTVSASVVGRSTMDLTVVEASSLQLSTSLSSLINSSMFLSSMSSIASLSISTSSSFFIRSSIGALNQTKTLTKRTSLSSVSKLSISSLSSMNRTIGTSTVSLPATSSRFFIRNNTATLNQSETKRTSLFELSISSSSRTVRLSSVTVTDNNRGDSVSSTVPFWVVVLICVFFTVILSLVVIFMFILYSRRQNRREVRLKLNTSNHNSKNPERKISKDNTIDGGESIELQSHSSSDMPLKTQKTNNSNDSLDRRSSKVGLWWIKGSSKPASSPASIGTSTLKRNQQLFLPHIQVQYRVGGEPETDSRPSSILQFRPNESADPTYVDSRPTSILQLKPYDSGPGAIDSRPSSILQLRPFESAGATAMESRSASMVQLKPYESGVTESRPGSIFTLTDPAESPSFSASRDTDIRSMLEKILQTR